MNFPSIRLEGSILSADVLDAVAREDKPFQKPVDFGFDPATKVKDEIASTWASAKALWTSFQSRIAYLKEGQSGVTETRNLFVLPLLSLLGYQPEKADVEIVNGKSYAISHRDQSRDGFPLQIMGWHDSLERKRVSGGPRISSHALVQEYLNLTEHAYGLITNGRQLRLLRDSSRLIKLSFLDFDLVRIFGEDLYADFALLFRLLHATRMPANRANVSGSVIEKYHQDSVDSGSRIRDGLAEAVAYAMQTVANGLLSHPANGALVDQLRADRTHDVELHQNLLRWVYRTLFVLVIEERVLNHAPEATLRQRQLYRDYYSLQRLRRLADRPQLADRRAHDLWRSMYQTLRLYEDGGKGLPLSVPPLGSFLFREEGLQTLFRYQLDNRSLLQALNRLSTFTHPDTQVRMRVNYGALDVEEFGSVYESLLELRPRIIPDGDKLAFNYAQLAGNERKTTGSYYTPDSLVQCLLDSALNPVVDERLKGKTGEEAEKALLSIKICDPAVGSGHFLIGAAHRLAQRLADIRAGEEALSPDVQRHALRDVVSNCLYGVDINPLSVELCKVSLWMLGMEPGKPLGFLDHHIQCGNSLLGATPCVLRDGLPDDAFKPIEGDDRTVCAEAKKRNKSERRQLALFHGTETEPWHHLGNLPAAMLAVGTMSDDTAAALHRKEQRYAELVRSTGYLGSRFLADAWCAAFVWKKTRDLPYPITNDVLRKIERNPHDCAPWMREEIERLRDRYQFFHWHLAFPEVFPVPDKGQRPASEQAGWNGGFDVMLGNPPWERVNVEARQFFATSRSDIADAITTKRRKLLLDLEQQEPELFREFQRAQRQAASEISFFQNSGVYPHLNQARLNTYVLFTELAATLCGYRGQCGIIVPSGIATDEISRHLFSFLVRSRRLVRLFDFENRQGLFADVHRSYKFCLLTLRGCDGSAPAQLAFFLQNTAELSHADKVYSLSAQDFELLSPISGLCPTFRSGRDREIVLRTYRAVRPFISQQEDSSEWGKSDFLIMFRSDDSTHLYKTIEELSVPEPSPSSLPRIDVEGRTFVPIWESKLLHQFDHRFATFATVAVDERKKGNAHEVPEKHKENGWATLPRYWAPLESVEEILSARDWKRRWLIGYRDITNATNERTAIASCLSEGGAAQPLNLFLPESASHGCFWLAAMNSMAVDYIARQRIGGVHLNITTCRQLPMVGPKSVSEEQRDFVRDRVLELTYTAWDLEPFARDCGWFGPPFVWDEARRFQLRCELDAAFLHLYGLSREDAAYILDTFPIVRRKDEAAHGTYRTKDTILALYDELAEAQRAGTTYSTLLDPKPASFKATHRPKLPLDDRVALDSPDKYLLVFVSAFLKQTGDEATFHLLDTVFTLLRHHGSHASEFSDALKEDYEIWNQAFNDSLPSQAYLPFIKRLAKDRWIKVNRTTAQITTTENFPAIPIDSWRNYDVSAALRVIARRPDITEAVFARTDTDLASRDSQLMQVG